MDPQSLRTIITNLENKLVRQNAAVESTETQIKIFGEQLELFVETKVTAKK